MNEFLYVIEELTKVFIDLSAIANIKLKAAKDNVTATIDECLLKEQSLILNLRGLDKKREDIQEKLGFKGLAFKEILEKLSEEESNIMLPAFDILSREIQNFEKINEDVSTIIKVNLRQLQKEIDKNGVLYSKNANGTVEDKSFTDFSV